MPRTSRDRFRPAAGCRGASEGSRLAAEDTAVRGAVQPLQMGRQAQARRSARACAVAFRRCSVREVERPEARRARCGGVPAGDPFHAEECRRFRPARSRPGLCGRRNAIRLEESNAYPMRLCPMSAREWAARARRPDHDADGDMARRLDARAADFAGAFDALLSTPSAKRRKMSRATVRTIIADVRARGDAALKSNSPERLRPGQTRLRQAAGGVTRAEIDDPPKRNARQETR